MQIRPFIIQGIQIDFFNCQFHALIRQYMPSSRMVDSLRGRPHFLSFVSREISEFKQKLTHKNLFEAKI